jgi:GPH family glycoside/pentoside/hexuronide:cation symporter
MSYKYTKVSLKARIYAALGSFGLNAIAGLFSAWTLTFYIRILELNPLLWAFSWLSYFIWNAINDPIFGFLSDRTNTKFGRRVPYLIFGGPLLSISFILLYSTPLYSHQWIYFIWLLVTLVFYDSFFTIVSLNFNSLIIELTIHPQERAKINFFTGLGGGIGVAISYILPILFLNYEVVPFSQNRTTFLSIVLIVGIMGAVFIGLTVFGVKEPQELIPERSEKLRLWFSTKKTLKNKAFLTFVIFNFVMTYVVFAIQSNLPFYMADVLNIKVDNLFASIPLLLFLIFSLVGYPLGLWLNKRRGNKRATFLLSIVVILGFLLVMFSNNIILANISFIILGLGYSGQILLVPTLLGDIIDKDELETGQRREGAYFGINALITKPAQSVSAVISGVVLLLTEYVQDLPIGDSQPLSAILGIKLLIGLIPAIAILMGLISLWFYPLDGITEEYKEMKKQVSILHEKKFEKLRRK